jgi:hypothetical protein
MELLYITHKHPLAPAVMDLEAKWSHLTDEKERATKVRNFGFLFTTQHIDQIEQMLDT